MAAAAPTATTHPAEIVMLSDLRAMLGYTQEGRLRRNLEDQGIPVFDSPNGGWTTWALVNRAGLVKIGQEKSDTPAPPEKRTWL